MQAGYRLENGKSAMVNNQTDNYTLTANDNGAIIVLTHASAKNVTVPTLLPVGFNCTVIQGGAGQLTMTESSTTIENAASEFKTSGQWARVDLVSVSADTFVLSGSTAA